MASATAAFSYILKVPVHTHSSRRAKQPPVAARLQARDFPARGTQLTEKFAVNKAAVNAAAIASAHLARVSDAVSNATLIKSQVSDYTRVSTDRRLMEAEANRMGMLNERASKAAVFIARVETVHEKNDLRKAELAAQTAHKLEAAKQKRERKLSAIQFKGADATAKAKYIAVNAAKDAAAAAALLAAKTEVAVNRRDRFLSLVASKAAFFNARHEHTIAAKREQQLSDAKHNVAKLESKMAAADYLHTLDMRLRQSKAALTNERVANVVERQRLAGAVSPMIESAKIRAGQYLAFERRCEALTDIAMKANHFVRKAVRTTAIAEMKAKEATDTMRANLEGRMAAATERKEELMATAGAMAGGGPQTPVKALKAVAGRGRSESPSAPGSVYRPRLSPVGYMKAARHSHAGERCFSAPTSPVTTAPAPFAPNRNSLVFNFGGA
eukprot:CAMPEP_0197575736 /NCGR_PEP_ID=MMETSP1326-20131121/1021_1 /TAXON_ID=1155430 /ORGANISM="Genus nov. species nov., Strain RCC2288" /LENGTH=441 /DNA_ID=CAMNT_0043138551 /DNA_START=211 /DNA_END=1536 /DNA_ORIENTATION=-